MRKWYPHTPPFFDGTTQANYYIDVFSVRYQSKYPRERPFGLGKVPVLRTTAEGSGDSAGDREATGKSKAS